MAMAGPRFFGFVIGGSLPAALAANWLAGAWDQNAAFDSVTPAVSTLEAVALEWLKDVLGLPGNCAGAFVTGATMANFSALVAARHSVLAAQGWDVEADGLFGAPPITVVIGEEAHPTLIKALGLVGFGRNRLVRVPVDGQGRMRAEALPPLTAATIVCAQAGNVNTGAFDPLGEIAGRTREAGRMAARRRRVRPVGGRGCPASATCWPARSWPTPGRRTPTSGSTSPTTAASPSCATPMRCAPRWPSRPSTCLLPAACGTLRTSPPSSRAAPAA